MRQLDLERLSPTSAGATVARSSQTRPDFLVSANGGAGLIAARWRRSHARLLEPQCLDDHLLSYCVSGNAQTTIVVDGVSTRADQRLGSITFVPAQRQVHWTLDAPAELVHVHIYIPGHAMCVPVSVGANTRPAPTLANLCDPWIDSYFRLMIAEYEGCTHDSRMDASTFLDETGGLLIRHLEPLLQASAATVQPPTGRPPRVAALRRFILQRIETYVNQNLCREIHLAALAELASMSVGHFLRAFHEASGVTPYQYVLERRLDRACQLLIESAQRVALIAQRCGFGSAAHFSTIFHLHRGCTPSHYRHRQGVGRSPPSRPAAVPVDPDVPGFR